MGPRPESHPLPMSLSIVLKASPPFAEPVAHEYGATFPPNEIGVGVGGAAVFVGVGGTGVHPGQLGPEAGVPDTVLRNVMSHTWTPAWPWTPVYRSVARSE